MDRIISGITLTLISVMLRASLIQTARVHNTRKLLFLAISTSRVLLACLTKVEEGEDEDDVGDSNAEVGSQDMHVDDILSGIAMNVASRSPPTPRKVTNTTLPFHTWYHL